MDAKMDASGQKEQKKVLFLGKKRG